MPNNTRRLWLTATLLVIGTTAFCTGPAQAEHLYVSDVGWNGGSNGDGTRAYPYWNITNAVSRARLDRKTGVIPPNERIVIHVAAGLYPGSYHKPGPNTPAWEEVLPIVLNVPNLTLAGATVLSVDANGIPTEADPSKPQTLLTTQEVGAPFQGDVHWQMLVLVTRTTDGGVGDNVTVSGLTLEQSLASVLDNTFTGVWVERVSGFKMQANLTRNVQSGVLTRLSSGVIEGNLMLDTNTAQLVEGGSLVYPAHVMVRGNRMTPDVMPIEIAGFYGLALTPFVMTMPIDLGRTGLQVRPIEVAHGGPDQPVGLDAQVVGNDLSGNQQVGLHILMYPIFVTSEEVRSAPIPVITATVTGNFLNGNGDYGLVVGGIEQFGYSAAFTGTFSGNQIRDNGRNACLFTFTYLFDATGGSNPYLRHAVYDVSDLDGELVGFDYDHPIKDPIDHTILGNILLINGVEARHGKKITPRGP